MRSFFIL